jgi:hypothetical protein
MRLFSWIKGVFNKFIKAFKEIISEAFPRAKQIVIGQLKDISLSVVKDLATTDLSNDDKRKLAFERIKTSSKKAGIETKDSLINLLIELTVQRIK